MKTRKRIKKLVITAGILALALFAPSNHSNPLGQYQSTITAYAAESLPYSSNWETQSDGSWKYKLNSGGYASGWIQDEVDKNWYYLESTVMQSGIYKSYGRYYLLSEIHDGHFGHLITNGEVYRGITITADTSEDYKGALSESSISALKSLGYNFDTVKDISGTQHVTGGEVVTETKTDTTTYNSLQEEIEASNRKQADELLAKYGDQLTGSGSDTSDILINGKPIH